MANRGRSSPGAPRLIDAALLRRWPLPEAEEGGDKDGRGRVVVVGGAPSMPGAALLAGIAALRAGAGKLQVATCASVASLVALAVPEALVMSLPETREGGIAKGAAAKLASALDGANAAVIGPGMVHERAVRDLASALFPRARPGVLVIDAAALAEVPKLASKMHSTRVVLTPHAGEMARMMGVEKGDITRDRAAWAARAARELRCVVVLKGAETVVADEAGARFVNRAGNVGLATSGSGDTLAGVIAGLAARGADAVQAAAWGVHLHALAGEALARRVGPLGFLARELLREIPRVMGALSGRRDRATRAR